MIIHIIAQLKGNLLIPNTQINYSKEINDKDPKFKIGDIVRISKYKNIFAKDYVPNCPEEVFVFAFCRHILLVILKVKKLWEILQKKNCKKQIRKSLGLKK